jgi:hypothetical protein
MLVVAPPPLPVFVGPGTSDRPEHISTNDPCANVVKAARREFIVSAGCSAILAKHQSKSACREGPFVQRDAADAKWIGEVLVGARTVAIDGYCEAVDEAWA